MPTPMRRAIANLPRANLMRALALTAVVAVGLASTETARAQNWTGAVSDDWFDPLNWSPRQEVPTATTDGVLSTIVPNPTVIDGGAGSVRTLSIAGGPGIIGDLSIINSGTLAAFNIGVGTNGDGTVTVSGTGSRLSTASIAGFGNDAGTGRLFVLDGGVVEFGAAAPNAIVFSFDPDSVGIATVSGAGSSLSTPGGLTIGRRGNATLTIEDGGAVSAANVILSEIAGSTGTINIGAAPGSAAAAPGTLDSPEVIFGDGTGAINFNHTATGYQFAPIISGDGTVNVLSGTTILTGSNTYTGATTINGGILSVSSDANLGAASTGLTIDGGTLLNTAAFTTARNITLGDGGGTFATQADLTATGVISGEGTLTKVGGGTLTLTGANTYIGGSHLRGGTLSISSDANLGDTRGGLLFSGGTLQNTAAVTMSRDIALNGGGGTFETQDLLRINGEISGAGSLTKIGSGNLFLNFANTYTGGTTVSEGMLTAAAPGALGEGDVLVESNASSLSFINQAGAGSLAITNNEGFVTFREDASAEASTINNNQGGVNFFEAASAADATIINNGGGTSFNDASTAGNADITTDNGGTLDFFGTASAGSATITNNTSTKFHGNNTAGAATIINNAGGTVGIFDLTSDGIAIGSLSGDGNVILGSKTLTLGGLGRDETIGGVIQVGPTGGAGSLVKIGDGTLTLTGSNTYTGTTTVDAGTLIVDGSIDSSSLTTVNDGGTLGGTGTVGPARLASGGVIAPGASIGTMLVDGDYTGAGGTLEIETDLAGGSADRLLISGNATGTTQVAMRNEGGAGPLTGQGNTDGTSIIQVGGNSSPGAFQLPGGYAAVGPYRYELNSFSPAQSAASELDPRLANQDVGNFWDYRLQSAVIPGPGPGPGPAPVPVVVPQIPAYQALSPAALQYGWAVLDNLHRRLGEIKHVTDVRDSQDEGEAYESFFRARGRSGQFTGQDGPDFDQDLWFLQAGANLLGWDISETGDSLRFGMAFSYGRSQIGVQEPVVSDSGFTFKSPGLALTSTYQAAGGWYLDTVLRGTHFDAEVDTAARGRVAEFDGWGGGASVETGLPFLLAERLILEPQAQIAYQRNWFGALTDVDGILVDLHDGDGLRGRLGGRLQKTFVAGSEESEQLWSPYLSANVVQGFLGPGALTAGGVGFNSDTSSTALLFGTGLNAQLDKRWSLYTSANYTQGLADGGVDYAWSGTGGARYAF